MPDKQLSDSLEDLRAEMDKITPSDDTARERLEAVQRRFDEGLDLSDESLIEELEESIVHFEADHPQITAILRNIVNTLSNTGI